MASAESGEPAAGAAGAIGGSPSGATEADRVELVGKLLQLAARHAAGPWLRA